MKPQKVCILPELNIRLRVNNYKHYFFNAFNEYDLHNADKFRKLRDILDLDAQKICSPYQLFLLNNQGEQILKFRKDNHLTQQQLAEFLNTDELSVDTKTT